LSFGLRERLFVSNAAIILFAHGAADPAWAEPFHALRQAMLASQTQQRVAIAYLERMAPTLPEMVAELVREGVVEITVVPVFLGRGGHLRRDFPPLLEQARREFPQVRIHETAAVGELPAVITAMAGAILAIVSDPVR